MLNSAYLFPAIYAYFHPLTEAERLAGVRIVDYSVKAPHIQRYGAVDDNSTDCAAAFTAALAANDYAYVPQAVSGWRVASTVSVPDTKGIVGDGLGSLIYKGANGAVFSLGRNSYVERVYIAGNSVSYTGVGITIPYTAEFEGYQQIRFCRIFDTASYCIEYVSAAAGAGFGSRVIGCDLSVAGDAVATVKWGNDPTNSHGNRMIAFSTSGGGPLVDCSNADNGFIIGNTIGDNGTSAGIIYGTGSAKIMTIGNRIASTTTITLQGESHVFEGNVCASGLTLSASAIGCHVGDANVFTSTVTDNSGGQSNSISIGPTSYTPTWTGSGSNPSVGNGSLSSVWSRRGRQITWTLDLNIGSTTTFGTGEWRFSLPPGGVSASQPAWGSCLMYDSSGTPVVGVIYVAAGATYAVVYMHGTAGTMSPTAPFTWANGDFLRAQISYCSG